MIYISFPKFQQEIKTELFTRKKCENKFFKIHSPLFLQIQSLKYNPHYSSSNPSSNNHLLISPTISQFASPLKYYERQRELSAQKKDFNNSKIFSMRGPK